MSKQNETNARLMAAAPDLLEASKAAIKYCRALTGKVQAGNYEEKEWGAFTVGEDLDDLFNDWMGKSHAAVLKAEGHIE